MRFADILMTAAKGGGGGGVSYTNIIVNGGFSSAGAPWSVSSVNLGSSVGGGEAVLDDVSDEGDSISQTLTGQGDGVYRVTFTISARLSGSMRATFNGINGTTYTTTGAKSQDISLANPTLIEFVGGISGAPVGFHFTNVTMTRIS